MAPQVIAAIIGVSSALLGTLVGGFLTYLSNKNLKLIEWQLSLIKEEESNRRKLYSDFLGEANRLTLFSIEGKVGSVRELDSLINCFSQVEFVSTEQVIEQAKKLVDCVIACNTKSAIVQNQDFYCFKKNFIEATKNELNELSKK